jgi:hypothetical protein
MKELKAFSACNEEMPASRDIFPTTSFLFKLNLLSLLLSLF